MHTYRQVELAFCKGKPLYGSLVVANIDFFAVAYACIYICINIHTYFVFVYGIIKVSVLVKNTIL